MPEYVLNRTYTLRTIDGVISFVKGEPSWVPPHMERQAASIGAMPVAGEGVDLIDKESEKVIAPSGDERTGQLFAAFDLLVEKNDSKEFTGQGVPTIKAVEKLVGFDVDRTEVIEKWHAYCVAKEEQK